MNFSLELKKIILSHSVTFKQPPEIVQIHMRHPVFLEGIENKQTDTVLTAFIKIHRRMTDKSQRIKVICTDLGGEHFSNNITHLF